MWYVYLQLGLKVLLTFWFYGENSLQFPYYGLDFSAVTKKIINVPKFKRIVTLISDSDSATVTALHNSLNSASCYNKHQSFPFSSNTTNRYPLRNIKNPLILLLLTNIYNKTRNIKLYKKHDITIVYKIYSHMNF
jgi:hypothetical protein